MSRILIVEDEERIASFVGKGLRKKGFVTSVVSDGQSALEEVASGVYDLMILDIGLPDVDGFSVLRRLREDGITLPIVVLTARDSVDDRVAGLAGGADDYVVKPFAFDELLARVHLRLRDDRVTDATVLSAGTLSLDLRTRRITDGGRETDLSAREFALAETFFRHPDQVLSREQLLSRIWGIDFDPGSNVVEVYVRYLRRKLGADRIETVRGMGYRFVAR
ncbi:response regulator transcription factor [Flexivirga sp. B27]